MNKLDINALALTISLLFSTGVMAEGMTKETFKADKAKISDQYKMAKSACSPLSGNANDICEAEARGKEKVALAELDASYRPSQKANHEVRVTKAEADYAVAKQRCDDKSGNVKDVCIKEAKAAETTAKADSLAQMKSAEANTGAKEKTADARKDAVSDKNDANYAVAKERCDKFSDGTKDRCLEQAKVQFNK